MQRIMLIGSGGTGKSTLAKRMGEILNLPVYHLDALYWKPGWEQTPRPEWEALHGELVARDRWIIDGNYNGTMETRMAAADMVIFMDMPRMTAMWGALRRRFMYAGTTRPDMAQGCPEKLDWYFLRWIWEFPAKQRPVIEARLAKLPPQTRVVRLRSRLEAEQLLDELSRR